MKVAVVYESWFGNTRVVAESIALALRGVAEVTLARVEAVTELGTGGHMTTEDDSATQIRFYPDGPMLVRGDFELLDENGDPIQAARRTIALCRCGRTAIPPFCDGTHTIPQRARVG